MKNAKEQRLIEVLEPIASEQGFELVDVELTGSGSFHVVRVYLDRTGGLTLDDIAAANSWVDAAVEEHEPFSGTYTLEVSSPGIDRPLRTIQHFERFTGEEARLVTESINGRGKWTGVLGGVEGDDILLLIEDEIHHLPFGKIKKAHLKGRIDFKEDRRD